MTINFNWYEVGFAPPSGSTTTTCFTTSSSTTTTSTTHVLSSNSNALLRLGGPNRPEYNGNCSLHVVQSRARCRTLPAQPSVTCPGERGLTSAAAVSVSGASATVDSRMESEMAVVNRKMDGWPECFQDVSSWCHLDRDELNTPQIAMQDEFNFSLESQVNCNNSWGYVQSPVAYDPWVNQDLLLASPDNVMITDEENNNYPNQSGYISTYVKADTRDNEKLGNGSPLVVGTNVLKTKGNILLSQATLLVKEDSPKEELMPGAFSDYTKLNSSLLARLGSGGKIINKLDEQEEFRVPVSDRLTPEQTQFTTATFAKKMRVEKPKPKLKLDISPPPPATSTAASSNLPTPEVIQSLTETDTSGFNLLNYVIGGENNYKTETTPKEEDSFASVRDHDYTEVKPNDIYIKCEPVSPVTSTGAITRKEALPKYDEDFDSDTIIDNDSDSEEWCPSSELGKKATTPGRRRGRKPSSVNSIDSSDGTDRYRALRDRNNEASRRSRLNRKKRDLEMRRYKSDLEKKNIELKVKADRMEALVTEMRAAILKSIRNRNKSQ